MFNAPHCKSCGKKEARKVIQPDLGNYTFEGMKENKI